MALVYFDSSALVKLVLNEAGSDVAAALWNACDAALSSRLAYPEVCAALAAAGRNHDLTESETSAATSDWEKFWASIRPVELTPAVEQSAGLLARDHGLRGADAVHLASARHSASPISPWPCGTVVSTPAPAKPALRSHRQLLTEQTMSVPEMGAYVLTRADASMLVSTTSATSFAGVLDDFAQSHEPAGSRTRSLTDC